MENDKDSDFFKALVHSIRSSCFKFLDFRENVSVTGFVVVDVDGGRQHHFVLEELVSRGKNNVESSFPLKTLTSTKSASSIPLSEKHEKALYHPEESRRRKSCIIGSPITKTNNKSVTRSSRALSTPCNLPGAKSRRDTSIKSYRPAPVFSNDRNDQCNLTFTRDSRKFSQLNEHLEKEVKKDTSFCTIDISPCKSMFFKERIKKGTGSNQSNNKFKVNQDVEKIEIKDGCKLKSSKARKRPHEAMTSPADRSVKLSKRLLFPNESHALNELGGLEGKKDNCSDNEDNCDVLKDVPLTSPCTLLNMDEQINLDKISFYPILTDSDMECSITSVTPNYLVGHTDDFIIDNASKNPKENSPECEFHEFPNNCTFIERSTKSNLSSSRTLREESKRDSEMGEKCINEVNEMSNPSDCLYHPYSNEHGHHNQSRSMGTQETLAGYMAEGECYQGDDCGNDQEVNDKSEYSIQRSASYTIHTADVNRHPTNREALLEDFDRKLEMHRAKGKRKLWDLMQYFKKIA